LTQERHQVALPAAQGLWLSDAESSDHVAVHNERGDAIFVRRRNNLVGKTLGHRLKSQAIPQLVSFAI